MPPSSRPNSRILAVISRERDHLLRDVFVVLALHPAPVSRVSAAVAERIPVIRIHAEHLDPSAFDCVANGPNQPLPLVLPFIATARRKGNHGRTPVTVDHDAHVAAEAM